MIPSYSGSDVLKIVTVSEISLTPGAIPGRRI